VSTVPVLAELDEATPMLARLMVRMAARFPGLRTGGVFNRRKIAGSDSWSQHAYGNAIDLYDTQGGHNRIYLDKVAAWLKAQGETRLVLWQVTAHYDHIHYEPNPKYSGTPPLAPGGTTGGNQVTVEKLQEMINSRGHQPPLKVDGVHGPLTQAAWVASGGSSSPQSVTVLVEGVIQND
jgi:hypothetical protein